MVATYSFVPSSTYRFNGVHNENVTTFLKEQLVEKYKDQFSKRVIHS